MPKYTVTITKQARKQLDKLSDTVAKPIIQAISSLSDNPRPSGCLKLKGRDGYRIRVGDYRVIYDIQDKVLTVDVVTIGHRREVYE